MPIKSAKRGHLSNEVGEGERLHQLTPCFQELNELIGASSTTLIQSSSYL